MSADQLWDGILDDVRAQVSRQTFETWFKPVRCLSFSPERCVLEVPNKFFREWFQEHNLGILRESISRVTAQQGTEIDLTIPEPQSKKGPGKAANSRQLHLEEAQQEATKRAFLNPRYTFDTFVVGSSNQFCHAACMAVAQAATPIYNPLFIYGGSGLGKTHLLHAIGHRALESNPSLRLCYISAERFMNELINSIRYERMQEFRKKYRTMDLLLIDDVHSIAGKERTQEEFFHTFNALYEAHRQIVISSDKMPKEMPELEERLRSRFECGLIADIQPPDLETKIAILKKKAEENHIDLPEDVALFIAGAIKSNIRVLEGALIRVGATASLLGRTITPEMAREILGSTITEKTRTVTMDAIKREVAAEYGIKLSDMKSKRRVQSVVFPRQVAMYVTRKTTDFSLPSIGREFGGKDHTTVIHAVKRIEKMIGENPQVKSTVESLINRITGG